MEMTERAVFRNKRVTGQCELPCRSKATLGYRKCTDGRSTGKHTGYKFNWLLYFFPS